VTCNVCGHSLQLEPNTPRVGLVDAEVQGSFHSTPGNGAGALDDCTKYKFSVCEFCLDWLFTKCLIPPEVEDIHGDPDTPARWRPAGQRVVEDSWRTQKLRYSDEALVREMSRPGYKKMTTVERSHSSSDSRCFLMADEPIEECWDEIRPSREPGTKEIPETQSSLSTTEKAEYCTLIAFRFLNNTPNWTLIEDQATNFMTMTDAAILETARRVGIRLRVTISPREQELINELNEKLHY